jgi:hypothetical protein
VSHVALALVHHPVLNRAGEVVTAAITNIDLHDIPRSAYSYGVGAVYVVHPISAQRALAERIRSHWVGGAGEKRIPDRRGPLELLRVVSSLAEALADWNGRQAGELWTTSARATKNQQLDWVAARQRLRSSKRRILIAFGTSWGLGGAVHQLSNHALPAIQSPRPDGYNHLSVRAAVAIILDRLLSGSSAAPESGGA